MNILALIADAFGGFGGISVYNKDLLRAMCTHPGVETVTAIPRKISDAIEPLPSRLTYHTQGSKSSLAYLRTTLKTSLSGPKPDLIYCAHVHLAPLALALRWRWRTPVLGALYGIEAWQPTGRILADRALGSFDQFYAISRITRTRFSEWSGVDKERIQLLPNAIHLDEYADRPSAPNNASKYTFPGRKVLLTFGRLVSKERAKGFDEIIDILPQLLKMFPSIIYVVAGVGDYRAALEAKVKNAKLDSHVIFTGYVPESEKADLYRAADVFVMPSRGEGFGFVFLEAMACGTPCVASSADGSADAVLDGKLGALVDPNDCMAIVDAIVAALSKPRQIPEGLDYFDYSRFQKRVHELINEMTDGRF